MIKKTTTDEYEYTLCETRTAENIDDVQNLKSEIEILYLNSFNKKILSKFFREKGLVFTPLFTARPHVFISSKSKLANKKSVSFKNLEPYPYLSFEQGDNNSFYFSEEKQSNEFHKKSVHVSDCGILFYLIIGINCYTISSEIITSDLNGTQIIPIPLSKQASHYIEELKSCIRF